MSSFLDRFCRPEKPDIPSRRLNITRWLLAPNEAGLAEDASIARLLAREAALEDARARFARLEAGELGEAAPRKFVARLRNLLRTHRLDSALLLSDPNATNEAAEARLRELAYRWAKASGASHAKAADPHISSNAPRGGRAANRPRDVPDTGRER